MFWTNYVKLCYKVGKSPNEVAAEIGVRSTGTVTGWKNGSLPRPSALKALSDYFSVSVDDLLMDEKNPAPVIESGIAENISRLSPELAEQLARFLVLAEANPDSAARHLAFAVQELEYGRQGR